jgi:hypothetical protein
MVVNRRAISRWFAVRAFVLRFRSWLAGGTCLLVFGFGIATLAGCRRSPPPADAATTQRVADAFLEQLRGGQYDAAWESTTAEFKSDEGRESFAKYVMSKPQLRQPLNFISYEVADQNGLKRGQCIYEPASASKSGPARIRLLVAQDGGQWRVEGIFVE